MGAGIGVRGSGRRERLRLRTPVGTAGRGWGMVSDEAQFFTDPDALLPTAEGVGPPGPIVSGAEGNDQVSWKELG